MQKPCEFDQNGHSLYKLSLKILKKFSLMSRVTNGRAYTLRRLISSNVTFALSLITVAVYSSQEENGVFSNWWIDWYSYCGGSFSGFCSSDETSCNPNAIPVLTTSPTALSTAFNLISKRKVAKCQVVNDSEPFQPGPEDTSGSRPRQTGRSRSPGRGRTTSRGGRYPRVVRKCTGHPARPLSTSIPVSS
ncbi:hypothetical protein OGAPHI_003354 [Ogataea philodendri]|uniref:Uncharacterized protein n=1 Tax=Ogataea philodendri TaxID=1378263 RepID=A0A9P8T607_9ASCO|nr:uncharacterized protein OGAPHI_003354 [Ogataea philodendri]KAH3666904.1 hypothetical protein OGAPHI_003354 [Ogataea philodendri]